MPSITDTLAAVPTLNIDNQPFVFIVEGDTLVGKWNITDSRWFAPASVTDIEQKYSITALFNEADGTYKTTETKYEAEGHVGMKNGKFGVGGSKEFFKGSMKQRSIRIGIGGEKKDLDGVGINTIDFNTDRIKEPLFAFLESKGWKRKQSLLSKLLGL